MKLKSSFLTQEMNDEQVLVDVENKTFSGIVRSNQTAAFIVDCLKQDTTKEEIVNKILDTYEVDEETVKKDVDYIISQLNSIGAIEC